MTFGNIPPFASANPAGSATPPTTNTTTTTFTGGAWTFTKDAEASAVENVVTFTVSDQPTSFLRVRNGSIDDAKFIPQLFGYQAGTDEGMRITTDSATDAGSVPSLIIDTFIANGVGTTRPSLRFTHQAATLLEVSGIGTWTFTKPDEVGVAEEMARWTIAGYTGAYLALVNSTTSTAFVPQLIGVNDTTNQALTLTGQGTTDTGTAGIVRFIARIGASTTPSVRSGYKWVIGASANVLELTARGKFILAPIAITSGATSAFTITFPADTGQTASTEIIDFNIGTSPTKQWATGAITTQRHAKFAAPTYSFVAASTITNAATVAITDAPQAGTNATITNAYAFWVQAGKAQFDGETTFGLRANLKSYTVATLPAVGVAGGQVYVSDAAVAPCVAFSNGTNWKRCDNAATTVV